MKNMESKIKQVQYESYFNNNDSPCKGVENVNIIVHKKKVKNRNKYERFKSCQQPAIAFRLSRFGTNKIEKFLKKHSSMPQIPKRIKLIKQNTRSFDAIAKKRNNYFNSKFIVNRVSEYHFNEYFSPFNYPTQKRWKVYRCQLTSNEDSCCCSCNSDAMFEVMKSLYDCYKKKNCDNCNCILCGHVPREERRLGEVKKSLASVGLAGSTKERREKVKKAEKAIKGKTIEEKEKILKELAKAGEPLPEGKTASEKALIQKIRTEVGLPPEPKTLSEKAKLRKAEAAGVMTPLEGKTHSQKEKILKAQADLGIALPEGRTASEKAIIHKLKTTAGIPEGISPEKLKKAKAAGLITPLAGKSQEQKERILRGLAMEGLPLPEGQTASERKLIDKVRVELGLPPEPKTSSMREKYAEAANAGLMQPLEGKSAKEKEKILQGLADRGIPLPEGRTDSEKKIIAKVKARAPPPGLEVAPSERVRVAKAAGLLTPLEGKTPEQKEKILRGLAMQGLPLPETKTASERKLAEKVRADLGLPPEPKTPSMKEKYNEAAKVGLLQPLEGKSAKEKERIIQGLHDMGIPLPEGRTASEKAIIAKVIAGPRAPPVLAPSEKLRKAKAAGLITPLEGKSPEQKEKILRGLAMQGIPLPEGKTASERKLIDKVRKDLGLPPEPKTASMRDKYATAADAGLLQPLEGKSAKEKEKILQGLQDMGIPLPEGRTASEKAIIAKVKAGPHAPPVLAPSEKLRKAKAAGLLTPLEGKTPEQKEKILRGLAMQGIPLPEGKTASERKLIDKVRKDLGLPPEPKTASMRDKYATAANAGLLQPLEGKSAKEKEKILQGLQDMGIPLPEGRTASEKAIIAKVKSGPRAPPVLAPSEKLRKAKAAGLLTPLEGKTPEQKEKILRGLAMQGIPLPEGKTASERKLVDKVRKDLGLPPEPKTASMRDKYATAADAGLLQPLEGKSAKEKEKILQGLQDMGIPLPEGRTASEKAIIAKVKAGPRAPSVLAPSEKLRKAKAAGLLTPLEGKSPEQKEKILRGLAMQGIPLPEGKTASERKLIDKVRKDIGLPPEPKTASMRDKYVKAADAGLLQPLEGKSAKEKEKILQGLQDMGIPLPEGRTASEKAIIAKVKAGPRAPSVLAPSEKLRKAKAAGLLTPLEGKTPEQKEKILRGLAMQGIPLPEGKTASERKLIDKVRKDLGLPPEPKTASMRNKYATAADAGLLQPLEGKSAKEKEKILQGLQDMGIPLPEGRTASEKAIIAKVKGGPRAPSVLAPSEKLRKAKAAGLLTPLEGKTPEQKEKILRGLAMQGIPLPEGKTTSERKLIDKVRKDLGLPPEPKTASMRDKYATAADAGLLQPLEGKSAKEKEKVLQGLQDMGIPLPEGRTSSEKAIIAKVKGGPRAPSVLVPSEKLRKAKAAGLLTPLEGKTPEQKEKILRGLAMQGIPLPEGKTASERKLIDKVRKDIGLPPEPKTASMRDKYAKAADAGLLQPLEGKSAKEKEKILQGLQDMGIPLPEGRTASEKAIIAKVKGGPRAPSVLAPSEKLRKAKAAGLLTPLEGKTPEQKEKILRGLAMQGIPLPEGKTASERKLIDKVRKDLGLPPEPKTASMRDKYVKAADAGLLQPLEGKSAKEKEKILQGLQDMGIPLPEGRTASEKAIIAKVKGGPRAPSVLAPSEKLRKAKAAGLLTPLEGKTPEQKEKILRGLAMQGIPLPEGKTASERKLIDKVRKDIGLPPEPKTASMREKYAKAADAGLLQPLEGKSSKEKEKILQGLQDMGIPLPEGRTASEKAIIAKVKAGPRAPSVLAPSEKLRKAKAAGLLTPLEGKTPEQKEKILRGLAMQGIPLPEGKTASERKLIDKVRKDIGLPPEPKTASMRDKYAKAADAGLLQPLEGKSSKEKEKILQGLQDMGIPLPEGRTASEKAIIAKVKGGPRAPSVLAPSEKLRKAKAAGLLTPLEGKTPEQKEKILRGLAMQGIPLPEGKTASERKLIDKVRKDIGLPPEPKTASMRDKYVKAADAGLLQPLEGKSAKEKEKILQGLQDMGIPLPEGRTASEKAIITKVKAGPRAPSVLAPSEKLRKAKAAGLLTPLEGKTPEQKEKILRGLAMQGIPLPEGKTASERKLIDKVRKDIGLPPEPKTASMRDKYVKAADAGLLQPLEGKSAKEKEKILQGLQDMGIPLPEGRTASEKAIIAKVKAGPRAPSVLAPSEKLRKAKAAGLLTPLEGKTPEQKEKILRGLAMQGIPLPEGKTASERNLIDKVRKDIGLPPEPKTASMRDKYVKAADAGLLQPLEGKSAKEKEKILQGLQDMGIPLPEGRTASEKAIIAKVKAGPRAPSVLAPSEKLRKAKAAGLLTPLAGKSPAQREKILRGLAMQGIPLPEGKTASEKMLIDKVRDDLGLPPEPKTSSMRAKYTKAADAGFLQPLEGKSPKEKERILQGLQDMGIPLPEGRTASEKALVAKVKAGVRAPSVISEKLRKAKAAGLLTPLEGKSPAQKEKIIKGLAMQGLPLPEGKTASERKLIQKVRADLGLPPEPKTPSMKEKYTKAANAGLMQPLEGKSTKEKEKILQGLHDMGIPLPEGRTASEKALIAKVKATPRAPSLHVPSEKMRKAQAAGLLTPLEGKTPAQQEKILRGLAMQGIPLPEGKTSSERRLADKVRADLGLPPAPKTAADREKYNKAVEAGLIVPLEGKSTEEKEKILRGQHDLGLPLPEGRTASEKSLIRKIKASEPKKIRAVGVGRPALPPEQRRKLDKRTAKVIKEGKGPADECICGLLTPESEREPITAAKTVSEKMQAAKAAGLLSPLEGKTPEQKEKILKGLAKQGLALPEGKTASEKKLIEKVRTDLGLPPEPKTPSMKEKYARAQEKGIITPLEGKTASQKEKILREQAKMGLPLPVGRTASEKAIIAKIKASTAPSITTEKLRKAKAAGLLTPLEGKTPEQKEKILRGLAKSGLPLPEGKTASEKALIKKIKTDLGIPEKTPSEKIRRAKTAGLLTPLDGKTKSQKEKILRGRAAAGLPLPEGKTPSEIALIKKIKDETGYVTPTPSQKMKMAKTAGLLTPLEGKSAAEKEKIIRERLAAGIPITEGKTPSEKEIIRKVIAGEPSAVRRPSEKERQARAAGLLTSLEGKTPEQKEKILRGLVKAGVPMPEPKSASERDLMNKIRLDVGLPPEARTPSLKEKYKKAQAAGIITPLEGKSPAEKEKILRKLHEAGIPLPEGRTPSEKTMVKRIKAGLPERKTPSDKIRAAKAAGLLTPLEGKTTEQKEKILKELAKAGLPMPEPKTASEKALSKKIRKELGLPPEPATASIKEKIERARAAGKITPLEGKTHAEKEKILKDLDEAGVPLPEGRTATEKAIISKIKAERKASTKITPEKLAKAKEAGLLTPLAGKSEKEKERIMRGLIEQGLPLPEAQTTSEKKIAEKIRKEFGLPPEPETSAERVKMRKAQAAGIITPLEGKTVQQKEKILRGLADAGIPLPEGRTASEKALIKKIEAEEGRPLPKRREGPPALPPKQRAKLDKKTAKVMKEGKGPSDECICALLTPESEREEVPTPSEKLKKAKALGLLTPLEGKTTEQKEKILRGLAKEGIPLPEPKTSSERKLTAKIRKELGMPPEPETASMRKRHEKAAAAGVLVPLEGLTPAEKERVLKAQADLGIALPEGRTSSEKALIAKVKAESKRPPMIPSEKIRKAKAAGLLTPLEGKSKRKKEKILKGLAKEGIPLPEPRTASERKLTAKIRKQLGLPPEPETASMREKHEKAAAAGVLVPLKGLTPAEKERVLRAQADLGIALPEGRTSSERALIARVKAESKGPPPKMPSEKLRKAKAAGLLTPLEGKTTEQKEKILRGLAKEGIPLPEPKTSSERKLTAKIRKEVGLPPEPETASMREKHEKAAAAGVLVPLEGLSPAEKERVLKAQADLGIALPEGRTSSEKALIAKVKAESKGPPTRIPSDKLRKAKAAGLLTPLEGKTKTQKEKILRGLAKEGIPLPVPKTASERKLTTKIRKELGLPPEPETASMREKHEKAAAAGVLVPLQGLTPAEKERVLRTQADLGIALPEGRTASEKALIAKVKAESKGPPPKTPSEKLRKAKVAGLLTPLEGKTTEQKEKILRGLAKEGIPLPEPKTSSERKLTTKIRKELGLPPEPETTSMREKQEKAAAAGVLIPLEGLSPAEKERVLRGQADLGIALPEGRTASEKALIAKVKAESKRPPPKLPSEKLRKAKAAGLLTPLEGKTTEQKEKILRGLAKEGIPLPEPKTSSERKLTTKIRKELGLPPEPETASMREKQEKAAAAGVLVPLEGLSPAEKERVLRGQADLGIALPEGRTASEKALIAKVKAESKRPPPKLPSEKLRKAKAAGLLTPLEGKTTEQKEKILRGLAKEGIPLPEPKSSSERKLTTKIRKELGLPPEPETASMREKQERAAAAGVLVPLEGLSPAEKEKVLKAQADLGIALPEGRTSSEKALIAKVKAESKRPLPKLPSEKLRKAKAAGLLTPLEGKTTEQKEKILRGLAKEGIPLPEPKTSSERKLTTKIRKELGLPPEPETTSMREKQEKAAAAGVLIPLEGLSPAEKERVLKAQADLGIALPEGRTASEKALIAKVKAETKRPPSKLPSEKLRKAKAAGLLTPLEGKTTEQKEKILRGLAKEGIPLPEPKTSSERKLTAKIRKELGLPPEPETASMREKQEKAAAAGVLVPLEGLSPAEKERVLKAQADLGIALPEGRTSSEKALIAKVKAESKGPPTKIPSDKLRKAKAAGLLTPLEGKSKAQKEKILRGLAKEGIPLPEPKTASERKLTTKIRKELGLPPEPETASMREKHEKAAAAGVLVPLQGLTPAEKERVLRTQADLGIALPEGRTASEKALIAKVKAESKGPPPKTPSEKLRKAKVAGLLTPLEGKTTEQKEKILRGLAKEGIPLPEPKTSSERKLTAKIRKELGLPPEPETTSMREKQEKAAAAGVLIPLEGLSPAEKERVLRGQADLGIALPEGRTASEKALIAKVKAESKRPPPKLPSEKLRKAKAAGLLTPLEGKTTEQKEKILRGLAKEGIPLPEPKTSSERKLTTKIRKELGLPPEPETISMREKQEKAAAAGVLVPLEGLSPAEKERVLKAQADLGIALPEGRTASEKALIAKVKAESKGPPPKMPSEKLRKARAAGLLTPLEGKTTEQKEKILRGLAKEGIPLPEPKTSSERKLTTKIRKELGLPPEPETASMREKQEKAAAAGVLVPLEGLSPAEKERVLKAQADLGIALPEGRTSSEKALIAKVKAESKRPPPKLPSEKLRKAKAAGLLTPLEGKTTEQKEKILRGLAKEGIPLPEPKTSSERKLTAKIRKELGLPPEPETTSMREKQEKAAAAGVLVPLEGLSPAEKERVLKAQADLGIALPEGRTSSEKALIAKVKAESKRPPPKLPSEKLRKAKAAGLLTPLEGKTTEQKEKILRGLAKEGIPLPEPKTSSERKLTAKIRKELGLPPEPETTSMREKQEKAAAAGVLVPLEGLSPAEKERVLKAQADLGIALPEGRTASEKALIAKVKAESKGPPPKMPSEKLRKARAAGLLTPLEGKTTEQKEKILRGLAKEGIPLPEPKTSSERKLTTKIRKELGLPPEPETASMREKQEKAAAAGVLVPLEGLSPAEKERVLKAQADLGIALPEGRTSSEKALIAKVKAESKRPPPKLPSEKLRKAKAAGLLTPLEGKTTEQKERILRGLAKEGIPLPEPKTSSERKLTAKIRKELGLPPEPETTSMREKQEKAAAAGVLVPLEGLSPAEKERVLKAQADLGIALPEGRTSSEKALIAKVKAESKGPPTRIPSEKIRKAKAAGLLTPLEGKTKAQKEKILRGLAKEGIPLPEPKTASERKLTTKIRKELGLPPEPETASMREKYEKAAAAGVLIPLEGLSQEEKKKVLRGQANLGIPLPQGRTASEKALIAKIKAEQEPSKIPSEKLRKAKAAGLLTPLEGKTKAQKEKIIKSLAEAGLPLPEGKTASEKALIQKIRTEHGIPPPAKTASEKSVVRKARAEGLLTPLAGKSEKEKERIVKGLIDAGLPVPEGKTASEKELIKKVRTAAGLPPEKTASERKVEIKTKSKKVGVTPSKRITKGIGAKAGIAEEYEDIIKTTTCDRGCGCDKKKIRFKHSYVKIRVTSPDISSLCPCPDECLPGVKGGAFIDNEGIKVTVGRVDGVTSYTSQFSNNILESNHNILTLFDKIPTNSFSSNSLIDTVDIIPNDLQKATYDECPSKRYCNNDEKPNYVTTSSYHSGCYDSNASLKMYNIESHRAYLYENKTLCEKWTDKSHRFLDTSQYLQSLGDICTNPASISCTSCESFVMEESSQGSFDSILVIKSESSLSLSTKSSCSMDVIGVTSLSNSSDASDSTHYLYYPMSNRNISNSTTETSECFTNRIDYTDIDCIGIDTVTSASNDQEHEAYSGVRTRRVGGGSVFLRRRQNEYLNYRLSQTKLRDMEHMKQISRRKTNNGEPIIVINNLDSNQDITSMVDQLLSNNEFSNTSSIFVVVPTSDDNDSDTSSGSLSSTICIQVSEHHPNWTNKQYNYGNPETVSSSRRNSPTIQGLKISARGKTYCMEGMQETVSSNHKENILYKIPNICRHRESKKSKNKLCQISTPKEIIKEIKPLPYGVSTDTTSDRPCCCVPKRVDEMHHAHCSELRCVANVVSELITPLLVNQGLNCDTLQLPKKNVNQQASFVSINRGPTSITNCRIPPCAGRNTCHHPSDMQQIPFGTPMPEPVPEQKPVTNQSQLCQCNPEKLKQLLEEVVKAGKSLNTKSTGCGGALNTLPQYPTPMATAPIPKSPDMSVISTSDDCATCSKPKHKDGLKMQCSCSGKKRTVRLRPLCPCEQHQPVSMTKPGPKAGTISLGCQCCCCDDSTMGPKKKCKLDAPMGRIEVVGPRGGLVQREPGGTYTQAGLKESPTKTSLESTTPKKNCECRGKNGKRKKNIICECPPEPEPEPVPVPEPEPEPEPEPVYEPVVPLTLSYEEYKNYHLAETRQAMKMRSDMTQTQSGFTIFKKKKPPPEPEVEFTVEDAVRYYATMNPNLIRDLCPPPQEFQTPAEPARPARPAREYEDCTCEEKKKRKKGKEVECECPYEPPPPPPPPPPEPEPEPEPEQEPEQQPVPEEEPFRGFKFRIGGKGSASKGLSGVCCFEMYQDTSRSRSRQSNE